MKKIAIIPARSGSKRIPNKNIKLFLGEPIISYVINTVVKSKLFDEVIVSTDSEEIATIAKQYGASVPFLRSQKNADDFATTADVLSEVLEEYKKLGKEFDVACCLYPGSVLVKEIQLGEALDKLVKNKFDTVFPVIPYSAPIQKAFKANGDKLKLMWPENKHVRSQDLERCFYDAGLFWIFAIAPFLNNKTLYADNSGYIIINEFEAQDIDNESDWIMAEMKFKFLNK